MSAIDVFCNEGGHKVQIFEFVQIVKSNNLIFVILPVPCRDSSTSRKNKEYSWSRPI